MFVEQCPAPIFKVEEETICPSKTSVNFYQPIPPQYRNVILPAVLCGYEKTWSFTGKNIG
jgi:hypothetical protein